MRFRSLLPLLLTGLLCVSARAEQEKAKDASADITCRFVPQIQLTDGKPAAKEVAQELAGLGKDISIKPVSPTSLFACANNNSIDQVVAAIKEIAGIKEAPASDLPESHDARLYFNRHAPDLADAISKLYPNLGVKALGPDLLVFQTKDPADGKNIHELKRWIALLDSPRPEITINAWSVQVSAPSDEAVQQVSRAIRTVTAFYNEQLHKSLQRGWVYLNSIRENENFPDTYFGNYVLGTYEADPKTYEKVSARSDRWCGEPFYCLGYGPTFNGLMQPTLSNFIGVLTAAKDHNTGRHFIDCMEARTSCSVAGDDGAPQIEFARNTSASETHQTCEEQDEAEYLGERNRYQNAPTAIPGRGAPLFYCFRKELQESLTFPVRLSLLRTAMADFLFQYKFSLQYPRQFEPFEYTSSAQVLDAQLHPLLTAFNRDMVAYLQNLQSEPLLNPKDNKAIKDIKFSSNGIVTLRTISGTDSEVDSAAQNAFRETPPPLAQDFLKNFSDAEKNLPSLVSANLAPHAAVALTAFLKSGQGSTVNLGRALNLKITPTSLGGASSAELKVHLEAKDNGKPQRIKPDGTAQDDTTDRVANHTVDTNIRVDSLGLWEISTLSEELSRGRESIPLLPPFLELPYIRSFLQYKPKPSAMRHRSFVIISATILPTAADLLNGMRFEHDRLEAHAVTNATNSQQESTARDLRAIHKVILSCIAQEANRNFPAKDLTGDCNHPHSIVKQTPADTKQAAASRTERPQ